MGIHQKGMTFLGLMVVAIVVGFGGIVGVQVVPTVIEYQTILKAVKKASAGNTVPEVRSIFDKATAIDQISSITAADLGITKENDKVVVSFEYQREIHLGGPAYLVMKYKGSSR
jgi:Tfp pilus assembly major pilin PilA